MDIFHDNSYRQWYKLGRSIISDTAIPAYVREYSPMDKEAASDLSDDEFADPGTRMFPMDTAPAVWLSAAYYSMNKDQMDPKQAASIETRIKQAADAWGVQLDVTQVMDQVEVWQNGQVKSASDNDDNFGWLVQNEAGEIVARRYPMYDQEGVTKAAAYFAENRRHYPRDVKAGIAKRIMAKAAEYGVDLDELSESVLKEAGYGVPHKLILMRELNERAYLAKDAEAAALLVNVNRLLGVASSDDLRDNLDKVAGVIDSFDRANDLTRHYGTRITHPSDFLVSITYKEAQDFVDSSVKLRRLIFNVEKLASEVPLQAYEAVLGPEFTKTIAMEKPATLKAALEGLAPEARGALEKHLVEQYS